MSLFWRNFTTNGKARKQPVNDLREALTEACEKFALFAALPERQKRAILLKELKKLNEYYRCRDTWTE